MIGDKFRMASRLVAESEKLLDTAQDIIERVNELLDMHAQIMKTCDEVHTKANQLLGESKESHGGV